MLKRWRKTAAMAYHHQQPPQQPYRPQQPYPPQQPFAPQPVPPPRRRSSTAVVLAGVGAAAVLLCCGGLVLAGALSGGNEPEESSPPAAAATSAAPSAGKKEKTLDDAGELACDDFAAGYKAAQTKQARTNLADKVTKWSSRSNTPMIEPAGRALAAATESSDEVWTFAADSFAAACFGAGWDG